MNLKFYLFSVFNLAFLINFAQVTTTEYSHTFGSITLNELNLKSYDKDTNAEAVVLYDIGKSSFYQTDEGFRIPYN